MNAGQGEGALAGTMSMLQRGAKAREGMLRGKWTSFMGI